MCEPSIAASISFLLAGINVLDGDIFFFFPFLNFIGWIQLQKTFIIFPVLCWNSLNCKQVPARISWPDLHLLPSTYSVLNTYLLLMEFSYIIFQGLWLLLLTHLSMKMMFPWIPGCFEIPSSSDTASQCNVSWSS